MGIWTWEKEKTNPWVLKSVRVPLFEVFKFEKISLFEEGGIERFLNVEREGRGREKKKKKKKAKEEEKPDGDRR